MSPAIEVVSNGTEPPEELAEGAIAMLAPVELEVKMWECLVGEKILMKKEKEKRKEKKKKRREEKREYREKWSFNFHQRILQKRKETITTVVTFWALMWLYLLGCHS